MASDYLSFNTDIPNEDVSATYSDVPTSTRNALSELDQNVQKESKPSSGSKIQELKQMDDQINREIGGQKQQMEKEALEKFLPGNVFNNSTFNFGAM